MMDPTAPPFVRAQTYSSDNPPDILAEDFYNPVQDQLAALQGAATGWSHSAGSEDFDRESVGVLLGPGEPFGSTLRITDMVNAAAVSLPEPPPAPIADDLRPGDIGVWRVRALAAGDWTFATRDNGWFLGGDFLWSAKVRVRARARLAPIVDPPVFPAPPANEGFILGLGDRQSDLPVFLAGRNLDNWQAWVGGTLTDTGVPLDSNVWYFLFIGRVAGVVRWYIRRGDIVLEPGEPEVLPTLVHTAALAADISSARRYLAADSNGGVGLATDYLDIDHYGRFAAR